MDKFDQLYESLNDEEKLNLLIHITKKYIVPLQEEPNSIHYATEGLPFGPNAIKVKGKCFFCGK